MQHTPHAAHLRELISQSNHANAGAVRLMSAEEADRVATDYRHKYVAISYIGNGTLQTGPNIYAVHPEAPPTTNEAVLSRVISAMEYHGHSTYWFDQVAAPRIDNSLQKVKAGYVNAKLTLAVLDNLDSLLLTQLAHTAKLAEEALSNYIPLHHFVSGVLEYVTSWTVHPDHSYWSRAWTAPEMLLSSNLEYITTYIEGHSMRHNRFCRDRLYQMITPLRSICQRLQVVIRIGRLGQEGRDRYGKVARAIPRLIEFIEAAIEFVRPDESPLVAYMAALSLAPRRSVDPRILIGSMAIMLTHDRDVSDFARVYDSVLNRILERGYVPVPTGHSAVPNGLYCWAPDPNTPADWEMLKSTRTFTAMGRFGSADALHIQGEPEVTIQQSPPGYLVLNSMVGQVRLLPGDYRATAAQYLDYADEHRVFYPTVVGAAGISLGCVMINGTTDYLTDINYTHVVGFIHGRQTKLRYLVSHEHRQTVTLAGVGTLLNRIEGSLSKGIARGIHKPDRLVSMASGQGTAATGTRIECSKYGNRVRSTVIPQTIFTGQSVLLTSLNQPSSNIICGDSGYRPSANQGRERFPAEHVVHMRMAHYATMWTHATAREIRGHISVGGDDIGPQRYTRIQSTMAAVLCGHKRRHATTVCNRESRELATGGSNACNRYSSILIHGTLSRVECRMVM